MKMPCTIWASATYVRRSPLTLCRFSRGWFASTIVFARLLANRCGGVGLWGFADAENLLNVTRASVRRMPRYLKLGEVFYAKAIIGGGGCVSASDGTEYHDVARLLPVGLHLLQPGGVSGGGTALRKAIALEPRSVDANLYMGMLLIDSATGQCSGYIGKYWSCSPRMATAIYYEGYIALLAGRFAGAPRHLEDAAHRVPNDAENLLRPRSGLSRMKKTRSRKRR